MAMVPRYDLPSVDLSINTHELKPPPPGGPQQPGEPCQPIAADGQTPTTG